jgi:DNA modification methylase
MLDFGFYNMDCLEGMKEFPDKHFDLAIVDPPYGAGFTEGGGCKGWFTKYHQETPPPEKWNRFGGRFDKYKSKTLCVRDQEETKELREQAEHGRRNTQKNHYVGCSPRERIF